MVKGARSSAISPWTFIPMAYLGLFIFLELIQLSKLPLPRSLERLSSKKVLGRNPYCMPIGIWKTIQLSYGKFLAQSRNRKFEGGLVFHFPLGWKLSAPPVHHLQDRSSECNRPFILMASFYWCRNVGPSKCSNVLKVTEWVSVAPDQRPHSQRSFPFYKSSMSLWQERIWSIVNNRTWFKTMPQFSCTKE